MSLAYSQKTRLVPQEPTLYQFQNASDTLDKQMIEKGNVYVDMLLQVLMSKGAFVKGSYIARDAVEGFCRRHLFTTKGSALIEMPAGVLNGLDTLHRADDCCLEEKDGKLFIHAVLGAGTLDLRYFGRIQVGNYYPQVLFDVNLDYIEFFLDYSVDSVTGRDATFHRFGIVDLKGLQISLANIWPLNKVLNMILGGTTRLFKGYLTGFLEMQLKMYIAEKLPCFSFPTKKTQGSADEALESADEALESGEEASETTESSEESTDTMESVEVTRGRTKSSEDSGVTEMYTSVTRGLIL